VTAQLQNDDLCNISMSPAKDGQGLPAIPDRKQLWRHGLNTGFSRV